MGTDSVVSLVQGSHEESERRVDEHPDTLLTLRELEPGTDLVLVCRQNASIA